MDDLNGPTELSQTLSKITSSEPTTLTPPTPNPTSESLSSGFRNSKKYPSSGHLKKFIRMAEQDMYSKREVVALLMFASEGDNSSDAKEMASVIAKSMDLDIKDEEWRTPRSWEGVFGEGLRRGAEEGLFW